MQFVEGLGDEIAPLDQQEPAAEAREDGGRADIRPGDAEHVAEQDVIEMQAGADAHMQHDA